MKASGVIMSGGPESVYRKSFKIWFKTNGCEIPILEFGTAAMCAKHLKKSKFFKKREFGKATLKINKAQFLGLWLISKNWMYGWAGDVSKFQKPENRFSNNSQLQHSKYEIKKFWFQHPEVLIPTKGKNLKSIC